MVYKRQIDGLRAVLFFAVFTYHHSVSDWFLTYALPCFFVLSGFLITRILIAGEDRPRGPFLKSFYARRALRILPLFYLFIAVAWFFDILYYPLWHVGYVFNIKLFLVSLGDPAAFLRDFTFGDWQHGQMHLWSLAVEEQFYLTWPFLMVLLPKKAKVPFTVVMIAASIGLRHWMASHETYSHTLYGAILPVCGEYILWGSLAGILQARGFRFPAPSAFLYAGTLGLVLLMHMDTPDMYDGFFQFIPSPRQTAFALAITALIIGLWNDDDALLSRFLRFPPLAWLGKMSYCLYVVHMATWDLASWLVARYEVLEAANLYTLRFSICVAVSAVSWYAFELPINRLKHRFPVPQPR